MTDTNIIIVETENSQLTYSDFNKNLERNAATILQWRQQTAEHSNERIGISVADPADFLTVYRAIQTAGKLPVVLDSKWTATQFNAILEHYDISHLITDTQKPAVRIPQLTLTELNSQYSTAKRSACNMPPEDLLHIGFTSGTTGMPKAYYRNRLSWVVSYEANDEILKGAPSAVIAPGPLAHSLTLYALMYAHHHQIPCYMQTDYRPEQLLTQLQSHPDSAVFLVPSILEHLLQFEADELVDIKVTFLTSGAKLEPRTIARF